MDVKKEPDRCRLCYTQVVEYVSIFADTTSALNIVECLKQYFYDKVNCSPVHLQTNDLNSIKTVLNL